VEPLAGVVEADSGFGHHQREVLVETVGESVTPADRGRHVRRRLRIEVDLPVANVDGERLDVVGPRVERVAFLEFEARVVPVASQDAVLDGATTQREPHVRTAVVDGVHLAFVAEQRDRLPALLDNGVAVREVLERRDGNHLVHFGSHTSVLVTLSLERSLKPIFVRTPTVRSPPGHAGPVPFKRLRGLPTSNE